MIVAADALNQNFEDALGDVLASQGVISPDDFSRLLDEHRMAGGRLADFLVRKRVLDRAQLLEALRVQTYRMLLQSLRWREGEFKFYSGEEVSFEEGFVPIPVEELLLRSVGDLLGEGTLAGTLPHGFVAYEALPASKPIRVVARGEETQNREPEFLWVTEDEKTILDRLDGRATADQVARETRLGEYKTLYALFRLLQAGLARPVAGQEPARAPEPAPAAVAATPPPPPSFAGAAAAAEVEEAEAAGSWVGLRLVPATAGVLAALCLWAGTTTPAHFLWPFPWLSGERSAFVKQQRLARYAVLDRAARVFFLVSGRFPDRLDELASSRILSARKLTDPSGAPLDFKSTAATYSIEPLEGGEARPELGVTEGIAGDFFLDPDFFEDLDQQGQPLVLLPD